MHFIEANCDKTQYRYPLFLTMQFDNLLKRGIVGETTSYNYRLYTGQTIHYSDILIDTVDWNLYSRDNKFRVVFHELTHALFYYPDLYDESHRYHFMYFMEQDISEQAVKIQLVNLLSYLCHK